MRARNRNGFGRGLAKDSGNLGDLGTRKRNTRGNTVRTVLPKTDAEWVILTLESPEGYSNAYELRYKASSGKPWKKVLNRDADPAK